ncbi:tyrosine-type recombinase/integrase [Devosia honganensis]|uniref:Tyrosine-type recombinase/integrase n=1 Tax=Devosia honganensis TaxID=1610527 RepID=A0ABV7X115_9HYPH
MASRGLTAAVVKSPNLKPGLHADRDGLYLRQSPKGAKSWTLIFSMHNRRRQMGLGSYPGVSLSEARDATIEARRLIAKGIDPILDRELKRATSISAAGASTRTFGVEAEAFVKTREVTLRNSKHVAQWKMTLSIQRNEQGDLLNTGYCLSIRDKPIDQIDTSDLESVLKPIWVEIPETASRLRGRIERVLDYATSAGHRTGDNPARWRGHLENLFPPRNRLGKGHHAAMPFENLPKFFAELTRQETVGAHALQFTILTSVRTSEAIRARWSEIDLEKAIWTIPADRMKMKREHRVPLSYAAREVLRARHEIKQSEFIFPGMKPNTPVSNMTMTKALKSLDAGEEYTVHGMRSTFRDWVGEKTEHTEAVAEAALAHLVGDATSRAYRRGDALEKRRELMDDWARYCVSEAPSTDVSNPSLTPAAIEKKTNIVAQ